MAADTALILGGGIIGLTCALRLQEQGLAATIADPAAERHSASLGNAGHLAVEQAAPLASRRTLRQAPKQFFAFGGALDFPMNSVSDWGPFAARLIAASGPKTFAAGKAALAAWLKEAVPAWRRLAAALGDENLVLENGHFVVWESRRSADRGIAYWRDMNTDEAASRRATKSELQEIATRVKTEVVDAIRFEHSGQISDLAALQQRLLSAIRAGGGKRVHAKAQQIQIANGQAAAILNTGERLDADIVLIAAGVASGELMESSGHKAPVIAERGYHIEGSAEAWPSFPPVAFEDRSLIVTRFLNTLRLASFVEFSRADAPPDSKKWRRLHKHAAALGISLSEPVREWMGARPTFPDYLPAIGKSQRADNLYYAFGHQHLGLTLAPVTAEVIAQLACGQRPICDPAPFDITRFG